MLEEKSVHELRNIIADVLEVEQDVIQKDVNLLTDLGADSLRVIEMVFRIEKSFGIRIDESSFTRMVSLEAVSDVVDEALLART